MNKCNYCNVKIIDATDHCPLCGSVIDTKEVGESRYPNVLKKEKSISFIFRLVLFISIITTIVCVGINYSIEANVKWSLIVAFSFMYLLLILYVFVRENAGYRVRTFSICAAGLILVIAIDYLLGAKRWSVNYVFPSLIILLDIALLVLMIVNHRNWQSYILILICMVLISIVPIILYALNVVTVPYVAQIALIFSLMITLGTLILGGPRVKNELYRRFHIMGK